MKSMIIKPLKDRKFRPVTISITAETPEDLRLLWHLFYKEDLKNALMINDEHTAYNLGKDRNNVFSELNKELQSQMIDF
jgi:hypothetical protein